jgi:hypothetical protein
MSGDCDCGEHCLDCQCDQKLYRLLDMYPQLYKHCKYFECKDGWFDIINKFSQLVEPLCTDSMYATQVKEKFGGIRFYMSEETEKISSLIRDLEYHSLITCETCGAPGKRRGRDWLYVSCDNHKKEE